MVPLVSLIVPAQAAVALAAPVMLVNNVGKVVVLRQSLDRSFFRRTMVGAVPGAAVGALLMGVVEESLIRTGIGLFLVVYVGWELLRRDSPRPGSGTLSVVSWGVATGFLAALVGGGGPTVAASMTSAGLTRQAFVATGAAISVAVQLVKLPIFAANGVFRFQDWPICLALCAVAISAAFVGRGVLGRVSERAFRSLLLGVLAVLGVMMLWN